MKGQAISFLFLLMLIIAFIQFLYPVYSTGSSIESKNLILQNVPQQHKSSPIQMDYLLTSLIFFLLLFTISKTSKKIEKFALENGVTRNIKKMVIYCLP
jgi:hypothetical protein